MPSEPKWTTAEEIVRRARGFHGALADAIGNPSRVWCRACGASLAVDAARCLRDGWPKCCGATMTIGAPKDAPDAA